MGVIWQWYSGCHGCLSWTVFCFLGCLPKADNQESMRNDRKCWFTVQGNYLAVRDMASSRQCRKEFSSEIVIPYLWSVWARSCPAYVSDSCTLLICHFRPRRCLNPRMGSACTVLSTSSEKSQQKMYSLGQGGSQAGRMLQRRSFLHVILRRHFVWHHEIFAWITRDEKRM